MGKPFGRCLVLFCAALLLANAHPSIAQSLPNKPIRIVSTEAGGAADIVARLVALGLGASLGQPVVVENRGGTVIPGALQVAKSAPDGTTLIAYGSTVWILPFLQDNVPYDPLRDFTPVTMTATSPNVLVVNNSLPVNSVKELVAYAKARPGVLNYGSGLAGASPHLAAELFKFMAGVNIVHVPYKGSAPAMTATMANDVQLMFASVTTVTPPVKAGKLRALGVASLKPSALTPDLPLIADAVPNYESSATYSVLAPAKTPPGIIARLNEAMVRHLNSAEVRQRLLGIGLEVIANTPEQALADIKADMDRMGKMIKATGIRVE